MTYHHARKLVASLLAPGYRLIIFTLRPDGTWTGVQYSSKAERLNGRIDGTTVHFYWN